MYKTTQFINSNHSTYEYKNVDGAGIINIADFTSTDTTHKYVEIEIVIPGLGVSVGKILVYNFNYQA